MRNYDIAIMNRTYMREITTNGINKKSAFFGKFSKFSVLISVIFVGTLITKLYLFPYDLPLSFDSLNYFMYSSDIFLTGELPNEWTPTNNGWPILVSGFFMLFNSDNIMELMQTQKILSTVISALMIFPIYFLCKIFASRKIAIIGVILIALEPRLMINSFLGITEPLYILLITTSLCLFLQKNEKLVYASFLIVGLATIVRGEGITLFLALSIMFLIRFRKERLKIIFKYLLVCGIFLLVVLPVGLYRIDVIGVDGIFMRTVSSGEKIFSNVQNNDNEQNKFEPGLSSFLRNLLLMLFPNFIIFIPIGIILIFKQKNIQNYTLIISACMLSIPTIYAYFLGITETRYFLSLYPFFIIVSILTIQKIIQRFENKNSIIVSLVLLILIASLIFYNYQKPDYDFEREVFGITEEVYSIIDVKNHKGMLVNYFKVSEIMDIWPMPYLEMNKGGYNIGKTPEYDSLEDFIDNSRIKGLSHLVMDGEKDEMERNIFFLNEIFYEKVQIPYLKQVYDSKENGFSYHVKVFEIDYKAYDIMQDNRD